MLKVEIVATIEMILNLWMRKALMQPSATPMAPATTSPITQLPPPIHVEERDGQILHDRGGDREGDVDAAGNQHHQQADGEDDVDRARVQEVEGVAQREEAVGREGKEQRR